MSGRTGIEWTDATWNPIRGCSRVSEGCRHCYAEAVAARFSGPGQPYEGLAVMKADGPHWTGKVRLIESALDLPLRWRKPRRIFVNSMSDLFHESVPDEWIDRIFAIMQASPLHIFQVLTKRPEHMRHYFTVQGIAENGAPDAATRVAQAGEWLAGEKGWCHANEDADWPLPNVWHGVSIEDANQLERVRLLRETPAAVRFISYEPALAPVDFSQHLKGIHWVIIGGESGSGARPFDVQWARHVIAQCKAAGVACFVKQLGAHVITDGITGPGQHWPFGTKRTDTGEGHFRVYLHDRKGGDMAEWPEDLRVREFPLQEKPQP